jgi:TPR repeat protein
MKFFGKACEGGHFASCYHQGALMYLEDVPSKSDKTSPSTTTTSSSTKSTTNTSSDTIKHIVPKTQLGPLSKKQLDAIGILEANCTNGESDSCYFVGSHYLRQSKIYYYYTLLNMLNY